MAIIETEQLTKKFKQLTAVNNLNLSIEAGDTFGFLGPNGAGKTTTIRMLTGFLKTTLGKVRNMGFDVFKDSKRAKEHIGLLTLVRLDEHRNKKIKEYSHGMRQRLVIAQALLNNPKLLFLDEPTVGLDPKGAFETRKIIKDLAKEGMTIFMSSHLLNEIQ